MSVSVIKACKQPKRYTCKVINKVLTEFGKYKIKGNYGLPIFVENKRQIEKSGK